MTTATTAPATTEAPATPPPAGTTTPPAPSTPPPAATTETGAAGSPEQIRADLADERRRRQAAEADLEKLRKQHQTDEEKKLDEARNEGKAEATKTLTTKLVRAEVKSLATGKFADPADAIAHLRDELDTLVTKDGDPDTKAIEAKLDALLKAKPHLGGKARPTPIPGGAGNQPTTTSFNDTIRRQARRG
jgi:hypothetical protein